MIVDVCFVKLLDEVLIEDLVVNYGFLVIIEEGVIGGFGVFVFYYFVGCGFFDGFCDVRIMMLLDSFIL